VPGVHRDPADDNRIGCRQQDFGIAHAVLKRRKQWISREHWLQLRQRGRGHLRFDEKDDRVESLVFQRGRIARRFDLHHARIPAGYAQTARADGLHVFVVGVERSHLGNGREGGGKQAADGTASDDEDIRRHDVPVVLRVSLFCLDTG